MSDWRIVAVVLVMVLAPATVLILAAIVRGYDVSLSLRRRDRRRR